jgi:hypothetical protein
MTVAEGSADSSGHRIMTSASCSVGVAKLKRFARPLVALVSAGVELALGGGREGKPFEKYWRSRRSVFSLEARYQGACGSKEKTAMPASTSTCFESRISGPWSQVSDRRNAWGSVSTFRATRRAMDADGGIAGGR